MDWLRRIFFSTFGCLWGHSKSTFVVEGEKISLKNEQKQTGSGDQDCLYVCSVKKIAWFSKQQTEFFRTCLAVAKSFSVLRLVQHVKVFFY